MGRRRQALELCQQVVEEGAGRSGRGLPPTEGAYLAWSLLSLEANDLGRAREQAGRALALCQQAHVADGVQWAQFILARVHRANGEMDALREVCRQARWPATRASRGLYGAWFAALEAQANLQQCELASAVHWAEKAGLTPTDIPHHWDEYVYFVYVRALLAQDRFEHAQTLLATMERSARQGKRNRKLISICLLQALAEQALDREKRALARAEEALCLAAPQDYRRAFLDEGPAILRLLPTVRHIVLVLGALVIAVIWHKQQRQRARWPGKTAIAPRWTGSTIRWLPWLGWRLSGSPGTGTCLGSSCSWPGLASWPC